MPNSQNDNDFEKERQKYFNDLKYQQTGKILVRIAQFMGIRQFLKFAFILVLFLVFLVIILIIQLSDEFDGYLSNFNTNEKNVYSLKSYNPKTPPTLLTTPLKVNTTPNKIAINKTTLATIDKSGRVRFWGSWCLMELCPNNKNQSELKTGKIVPNLNDVIGIRLPAKPRNKENRSW